MGSKHKLLITLLGALFGIAIVMAFGFVAAEINPFVPPEKGTTIALGSGPEPVKTNSLAESQAAASDARPSTPANGSLSTQTVSQEGEPVAEPALDPVPDEVKFIAGSLGQQVLSLESYIGNEDDTQDSPDARQTPILVEAGQAQPKPAAVSPPEPAFGSMPNDFSTNEKSLDNKRRALTATSE